MDWMFWKKKPVVASFHVSPPIYVEGGYVESMLGPLSEVLNYLYSTSIEPKRILAFGQNGTSGIRTYEELALHVIVFEPLGKPRNVFTSLPAVLISALMQPGFDYAHMIAGFKNGVRLIVSGQEFSQNPFGESIMRDFFSVLFNQNNTCRWCEDETNVLLLAAHPGPRAVFAKMQEHEGTYKEIPLPNIISRQPRHAVIGKEYLFMCEQESCYVYLLHQDMIAEYLYKSLLLSWHTEFVPNSYIEEIGVVDGAENCGVLTLKNLSVRYLPFHVQMVGARPSVRFLHNDAVLRSDVASDTSSSVVVRVRQSGTLVLSQQQGPDSCIQVVASGPFPQLINETLQNAGQTVSPP